MRLSVIAISLVSLAKSKVNMSSATSCHTSTKTNRLNNAQVLPVTNGAVAGPAVDAGALWSDAPATCLFVVRRPG
jgi:hypothetical protein